MVVQTANFTGTNGQTATAANTGMLAWVVSGGTAVFDSSWMPRGQVALRVTATTASGALYARHAFTATTQLAYHIPVKPLAWPNTADDSILRLASSNGNTRNLEVTVFSDGSIAIRNSPFTVVGRSTAGIMTLNTGCIVSVFTGVGSSTGTIRLVVFEEDETTIRYDTGLLTGQNTGTTAIDSARTLGAKIGTSTRTSNYLFGEPAWDTAATDIIPPPNAIPKAAFAFTASDLTINTDATASSDDDGIIVGYEWDWGGGAGYTSGSVTASHTYTAAGTYTVRLRVTDNDGATGETTQNIPVTAPPPPPPPAAQNFYMEINGEIRPVRLLLADGTELALSPGP